MPVLLLSRIGWMRFFLWFFVVLPVVSFVFRRLVECPCHCHCRMHLVNPNVIIEVGVLGSYASVWQDGSLRLFELYLFFAPDNSTVEVVPCIIVGADG